MQENNKRVILGQDPIILNKLGDLDKTRLQKLWSQSEVHLTEDHLLLELDKKIIQLKTDICS
jgi:hypothetical protein